MATPKYKIGDKVRLVRASKHELGWWHLESLAGSIMKIRYNGRSLDNGNFIAYSAIVENCLKNDMVGITFEVVEDMLDPLDSYKKGEMIIRLVHTSGESEEIGVPVDTYEQMTMAALAAHVLKGEAPVTGTKSLIDTPKCSIMTVGVADRDAAA